MPQVADDNNGKKKDAIVFDGIYKKFGEQIVCNGISFSAKQGEVLSILGPSGCGKTITIKMLIGLILPDQGSIIFQNQDLAKFTKEEEFFPIRQRISMVFQGSALFDSLTVYDNIAYPLRVAGKKSNSEIEDRIYFTLNLVGLPDSAKKMPSELSGGMKKRIGLARAIVTSPEVILYDEPTAGLDPINTRRIVDLILMLKEKLKCTSVIIAHDMGAVEAVSDHVALFYSGRVRQLGRFKELYESDDAVVRGFVRGDPSILLTTHGSFDNGY